MYSSFSVRSKSSLNMAIPKIFGLREKSLEDVERAKKQISFYMAKGQSEVAKKEIELVIRELNFCDALGVLLLHLEHLVTSMDKIKKSKYVNYGI